MPKSGKAFVLVLVMVTLGTACPTGVQPNSAQWVRAHVFFNDMDPIKNTPINDLHIEFLDPGIRIKDLGPYEEGIAEESGDGSGTIVHLKFVGPGAVGFGQIAKVAFERTVPPAPENSNALNIKEWQWSSDGDRIGPLHQGNPGDV